MGDSLEVPITGRISNIRDKPEMCNPYLHPTSAETDDSYIIKRRRLWKESPEVELARRTLTQIYKFTKKQPH